MSEERISKLEKLLEKNPQNALARYAVANEYFKLGRHGEAVRAVNAYLELKDDEGAAYRMLGHCYAELEMPGDAKRAYQKGAEAARRHGHPDMAEELADCAESVDLQSVSRKASSSLSEPNRRR